MRAYKIGITEAGDAGVDLSWVNKMETVDGAVLITKCISPAFVDAAMKFKDKVIVHATITGYGGTILEPLVPYPYEQYGAVMYLIEKGFPKEKIVIRVDPIIPTKKGCERALNVIKTFIDMGFNRYRISVIDMYPHVRERFKTAGLPLPYGSKFSPSEDQLKAVDSTILDAKSYLVSLGKPLKDLRIESCAEPGLTEAIACGCISRYDLNLIGLYYGNPNTGGYQRKNCMCYSGKTELLEHKQQCPHQCLYCYWKTKPSGTKEG